MMSTQLIENLRIEEKFSSFYSNGKVLYLDSRQLLVTIDQDKVNIVNLKDLQILHSFEPDGEVITDLVATDEYLILNSRSLQTYIYKLTDYSLYFQKKLHTAPVLVSEISSCGSYLVTGSADSTVKVFDLKRKYETHHFKGHGGIISAVKLITLGKTRMYLVTASLDLKVRVFDLTKNQLFKTFEGHSSVIRALDYNLNCGPTGKSKVLIVGSRDNTVSLYDLNSWSQIRIIHVEDTVESVVCFKETFLTVGEAGKFKGYKYTGETVLDFPLHPGPILKPVLGMSKLKDTNLFVYDENNVIRTFNYLDGSLKLIQEIAGFVDEAVAAKFLDQDNGRVAIACNAENLRIFDPITKATKLLYGHTKSILAIDYLHGTLVTASKDATFRVWRLLKDEYVCIAIGAGHAEAIGTVAIAPNGNLIVTGSMDRTVKVWDISSLTEDMNGDVVELQSIYTVMAHQKDINCVKFHPKGHLFATGSQDKKVKLFNLQDGALLNTLEVHKRGVWALDFHPTLNLLATASGDRTVKVTNLSSLETQVSLEAHNNAVLSVNFIKQGQQLLVGTADGNLKLWNWEKQQEILSLDLHDGKVWNLAHDKDTSKFVSVGSDGSFNMLVDSTEEILKLKQEQITKETEDLQILENLVYKNYLDKALHMSLVLDRPRKLLEILRKVINSKSSNSPYLLGSHKLDSVFTKLDSQLLQRLLTYLQEWNTNGRTSTEAQLILNLVFKSYPMQDLIEIKVFKELIRSLIPYTTKHYNRCDRLITETYLIDHCVDSIDMMAVQPDIEMEEIEMEF